MHFYDAPRRLIEYLLYAAGEGDGFAEDVDVVHFFVPIGKGTVLRIFRLQNDMIVVETDTFQRCLVVDQNGGDLSAFNGVLLTDIDDVAVEDTGIDHAVTLAAECEIGVNMLRYVNVALVVLGGEDGYERQGGG